MNSDTFLEEYNHLGEEFEQVKEDDGTCYFVAKLTTPPTEEEFQTASRRIFGQPLQRRIKSAQEIAVEGWKELESFTGVLIFSLFHFDNERKRRSMLRKK